MHGTISHNRQYASRPADLQFATIADLIRSAEEDRALSVERGFNLKDLRAVPIGDGLVLESSKGQASMSNWSYGQLCRIVGAPAGYLANSLPSNLAADCLNHGIESSDPGTTVNLLVRGQNGAPPLVRSVNSETYGRLWDSEFYRGVDDVLFSGSRSMGWSLPKRGEGKPTSAGAHRSDRDSFVTAIASDSGVADPSSPLGPMYRGIMLRNSEVGASGVVIECVLYRPRCSNLQIWGSVIDRSFRRRHVGKHVLRHVLRELATIGRRWAERPAAHDEAIIRALISHEIATTEAGVVDELHKIGATKEQAKTAYATAVRTEEVSPRSFWGIAQGLTRDAQETDYQNERYELDKLAGLVLARGARLVAA